MRPLSSQEDIYVMNPAGKVAVAWCVDIFQGVMNVVRFIFVQLRLIFID